jgi:hypothetical protein
MRMEDVASDQVTKCASHYNIGGEVLQTGESRHRNGRCGSVSEPLYPRLWVFVRNCAGRVHVMIVWPEGNELSEPLVEEMSLTRSL